jgi:hypothetical protein
MKRSGFRKLFMLYLCLPTLPAVFAAPLRAVLCAQSTQASAPDHISDSSEGVVAAATVIGIFSVANLHLNIGTNGGGVFNDCAL